MKKRNKAITTNLILLQLCALCIFGQYTKYESKAGEDVCKHNCTKLRKKILKCNL